MGWPGPHAEGSGETASTPPRSESEDRHFAVLGVPATWTKPTRSKTASRAASGRRPEHERHHDGEADPFTQSQFRLHAQPLVEAEQYLMPIGSTTDSARPQRRGTTRCSTACTGGRISFRAVQPGADELPQPPEDPGAAKDDAAIDADQDVRHQRFRDLQCRQAGRPGDFPRRRRVSPRLPWG